jgi:hypothetical protein
MQDFAYKISKIFRGLYPRTPLAGGGDPLPAPSPRSAYGLARGRFAPPAPQTQTSWQVPPTGSHHKSHPANGCQSSNWLWETRGSVGQGVLRDVVQSRGGLSDKKTHVADVTSLIA